MNSQTAWFLALIFGVSLDAWPDHLSTRQWDTGDLLLEAAQNHLVANLDGDGKMEFVFHDYNGPFGSDVSTLSIFNLNDSGELTPVWSFSDGPMIFTRMLSADTDLNGVPELIVGRIGGGYLGRGYAPPRIYFFESSGSGSFYLKRIVGLQVSDPGMSGLFELAVEDMDGDGYPEIIAGLSDSESLYSRDWGSQITVVSYGARTGYTQNIEYSYKGTTYLTAMGTGDSNHDGKKEILFFEQSIPTLKLLERDSSGYVLRRHSTGIRAGFVADLLCRDTDGDGSQEIVLGTQQALDGITSRGHITILGFSSGQYREIYTDPVGTDNTILSVAATDSHHPVIGGSAHSGEALFIRYVPSRSQYRVIDRLDLSDPSRARPPQLTRLSMGKFDGDSYWDVLFTEFNTSDTSSRYSLYEQCPGAHPCH